MTRATVSESVLRWALERSGRSAATIERKFPKLSEWLSGKRQPTLHQLEEFAKATSAPLGYLFLREPPKERLPIPHFRTLGEDTGQSPSADLLETVQMMQRRQAWMRDYLIEQGHAPVDFVRSDRRTNKPESIAYAMQQTLGLAQDWAAGHRTWTEALRELQRRMENAGILVVVSGIVGNNTHRKLDPSEFRGFVLVDEYVPLVFVNGADGKAAQMFTLAHELAHVWLGSSAAFDLRELQPADDKTEIACNHIAAEFLIPADRLRQIWLSVGQAQDPYQEIARNFKVSAIVAARRALDLNLITKNEFLRFYVDYQADERRRSVSGQEGGNFYATQSLRLGQRFAKAVVRATREGRLLYHEAYQLTGLYGKTFERYAKHLDFGGAL